MTSSLRHKTKFCCLFLQIPKVQSNIYRMMVWNKLNLEWFRSYSHFKMSNFGGREIRERVGYRNISCTYVIVPWLKVRLPSGKCVQCVTFIGCCVLLLDDVISWWMFLWRSGALTRAQIQFLLVKAFMTVYWSPGYWALAAIQTSCSFSILKEYYIVVWMA